MHDDPTQIFPESQWKRHATERICLPVLKRDGLSRVPVIPAQTDPAQIIGSGGRQAPLSVIAGRVN